ncbi:twin-arginine translocase subunit TatC [Candidatus Bipolaricaulota bacterium]|nr:twin-arginine translocase subunit TatC [Candidatus Bipolaricaulota bacterium]
MKDEERPLGEHLEELRSRIISSLAAIVLLAGAAYYFRIELLEFLLRASSEESLIYLHPTEAFLTYLKLAVITGLILSTPWLLYQAWKFIAPALLEKEARLFRLGFFLGGVLFYFGIGLAVTIGIPYSVRLLTDVGGDNLVSSFTVRNYITFSSLLSFASGLIFELPLLIYLMVRLGFVSPATLRNNRKYVIIIAFTTAAFITPTDFFSQAFMAIPLVLLYELSVALVGLVFGEEGPGDKVGSES